MTKIKKILALFAKPKLRDTGKRFRDKLRRALSSISSSMVRVFGKRGSMHRRVVNVSLLALFAAGCERALNDPEIQRMAVLMYSKAESYISSLTSKTLESSSSTSTLENSSRSKYIYFIVGFIVIVANAILWQYTDDGEIKYRFRQSVPEPEKTSELLKIAEKIYDYLPEPLSQLLILAGEIGGIFIGGSLLFADLEHNGPITSLVQSIIDLFK